MSLFSHKVRLKKIMHLSLGKNRKMRWIANGNHCWVKLKYLFNLFFRNFYFIGNRTFCTRKSKVLKLHQTFFIHKRFQSRLFLFGSQLQVTLFVAIFFKSLKTILMPTVISKYLVGEDLEIRNECLNTNTFFCNNSD